jgi:hypothetical protein
MSNQGTADAPLRLCSASPRESHGVRIEERYA